MKAGTDEKHRIGYQTTDDNFGIVVVANLAKKQLHRLVPEVRTEEDSQDLQREEGRA
jgi:hypothetical protein